MFRLFKRRCTPDCSEGHTYGPRCLMVTDPKARKKRLETLLGAADALPYILRAEKHERR